MKNLFIEIKYLKKFLSTYIINLININIFISINTYTQ